jgi:hypothetical protein
MQVVNMDSFAMVLQLDQPKAQNFKIGNKKIQFYINSTKIKMMASRLDLPLDLHFGFDHI